jgi:hypothetical protein
MSVLNKPRVDKKGNGTPLDGNTPGRISIIARRDSAVLLQKILATGCPTAWRSHWPWKMSYAAVIIDPSSAICDIMEKINISLSECQGQLWYNGRESFHGTGINYRLPGQSLGSELDLQFFFRRALMDFFIGEVCFQYH